MSKEKADAFPAPWTPPDVKWLNPHSPDAAAILSALKTVLD
jgi:hypothetical protein